MPFPINKKYVRKECLIYFPVEKMEIPKLVQEKAEDNGLIEKPEFHVSVVVAKNARQVADTILQNKNPEKIWAEITNLADSFQWEYFLTNKYSLHEKFYDKEELIKSGYSDLTEHNRRTIVQEVDMPDMRLFYEKLNFLLGIELPVPLAHITLFTWSDYLPMMSRGIGICSETDFSKFLKERITVS